MRARTPLWFLTLVSPLLSSCGNSNFDPASKVESIRILSTKADNPYVQPGQTVNMEVLAVDARPSQPTPMTVYWVPIPCVDPPADAYYACYPAFEALAPPGTDITSMLTTGDQFSFTMPADAVTRHSGKANNVPYGMAVVFTIACSGRVQVVARKYGDGPNANPVGCFDDNGKQLPADDFVFAFSQVFSFTSRTNANPVIDHVAWNGSTVDLAAGITIPHCTSANAGDCAKSVLDVFVPASSQELDPSDIDPNGKVLNEQIYADYFVTNGSVDNDAIVLYDPTAGKQSTSNKYTAPQNAGENRIWVVVHDNRGGAAWVEIPVHVT